MIKRFLSQSSLLLCLLTGISCHSDKGIISQTPGEFSTTIENILPGHLLDVRTPEEYAMVYIAEAVNINIDDSTFLSSVDSLVPDKQEPVAVYCRSGVRSLRAAKLLRKHGYAKVYNLKDGLNSWRSEGYDVK